MKKLLLICGLALIAFGNISAQYLPIVKQGRTWYSLTGLVTTVIGVEGDTLINGTAFPLLVYKDSTGIVVDTLAYLDEDTVQGTLRIDFFGKKKEQFYDFGLQQGDTLHYANFFTQMQDSAIVDTVYNIVDFRNVTRKVLEFRPADQSVIGCEAYMEPWIEGLGSGFLPDLLYSCRVSHVPFYSLRCAFDDTLKIYGDTVQKCFIYNTSSIAEQSVAKVDLYPNPATSSITIAADVPIARVEVKALNGATLVWIENPSNTLDVSSLPKGIYIVEIIDVDGGRGMAKFVKD